MHCGFRPRLARFRADVQGNSEPERFDERVRVRGRKIAQARRRSGWSSARPFQTTLPSRAAPAIGKRGAATTASAASQQRQAPGAAAPAWPAPRLRSALLNVPLLRTKASRESSASLPPRPLAPQAERERASSARVEAEGDRGGGSHPRGRPPPSQCAPRLSELAPMSESPRPCRGLQKSDF